MKYRIVEFDGRLYAQQKPWYWPWWVMMLDSDRGDGSLESNGDNHYFLRRLINEKIKRRQHKPARPIVIYEAHV